MYRGGLTYGQPQQDGFEEGIVFSQQLKDFFVRGDVDEDREGIFSYRLLLLSISPLSF